MLFFIMKKYRIRETLNVGTMVSREKHPGSFDIIHIKDLQGHIFATIGKGNKPFISLPKGKGI